MSDEYATREEAEDAADAARAMFADSDWEVTVWHPLFAGDTFRVTVG
jgi:hypothetical protein